MPNTPLSDAQSVTQPLASPIYTEASVSRTTSGSITVTPPPGATRLFVGINVTVLSGAGATQTFTLLQQDANGIFQPVTLGSAIALTAVGGASFSVGEGQTNGLALVGPVKIVWTASGTVTTCSFQIAVTAR